MSFAEIQRLDAGQGQRILALDEVLQATRGRVGLILELKVAGLARQSLEMVRRNGFPGPVIYASFLTTELLPIRQADSCAVTMALFDTVPKDPVAATLTVKATHAGLRWNKVTKALIRACHDAGLHVVVYTVNDPRDIRQMRALGVDGIISDFPDRL